MCTPLKYLIPLSALLTTLVVPAVIPEARAARQHSSISIGMALQNHAYAYPRWRNSRALRPHFRSNFRHFPTRHVRAWERYPYHYPGLGSRAYVGMSIPFGYVERGYMVLEAPEIQTQPQPQRTYPPSDLVVEVSRTHMRSAPGKGHPVTGQAFSGQPLTIVGEAPGWYYVQHPHGHFGWVPKSHTRPTGDASNGN